jgi:chromosome segregation ATPase
MSGEPDNLVLNMLRAIRADIATLRDRQEELIDRVGRVEREIATLRREIADLHGDFASLSGRIDNLGRVRAASRSEFPAYQRRCEPPTDADARQRSSCTRSRP